MSVTVTIPLPDPAVAEEVLAAGVPALATAWVLLLGRVVTRGLVRVHRARPGLFPAAAAALTGPRAAAVYLAVLAAGWSRLGPAGVAWVSQSPRVVDVLPAGVILAAALATGVGGAWAVRRTVTSWLDRRPATPPPAPDPGSPSAAPHAAAPVTVQTRAEPSPSGPTEPPIREDEYRAVRQRLRDVCGFELTPPRDPDVDGNRIQLLCRDPWYGSGVFRLAAAVRGRAYPYVHAFPPRDSRDVSYFWLALDRAAVLRLLAVPTADLLAAVVPTGPEDVK